MTTNHKFLEHVHLKHYSCCFGKYSVCVHCFCIWKTTGFKVWCKNHNRADRILSSHFSDVICHMKRTGPKLNWFIVADLNFNLKHEVAVFKSYLNLSGQDTIKFYRWRCHWVMKAWDLTIFSFKKATGFKAVSLYLHHSFFSIYFHHPSTSITAKRHNNGDEHERKKRNLRCFRQSLCKSTFWILL